jgi:hypothetical protein
MNGHSAHTPAQIAVRSYGIEPERLDGRHGASVAATLPLGVPLS